MTQTNDRYLRFPLLRRIEHWLTAGSFITLALTGLPQKYADSPISEAVFSIMGGVEVMRVIHRVSAVILALVAVWHVGLAIWKLYVRREPATMLPNVDDGKNALQTLLYNIGRTRERPQQGWYTFEEKMEYWALVWGTLVMVVTGFFLWNPITAARLLPGEWIPAAKAAHGGEALLAVLAIIIWHLYHVLVRTFNRSMFTGYLSKDQMEHEHRLALHAPALLPVDEDRLRKRKRNFWATYGVIATIWLVGIVWFVTTEETAQAVVPPPHTLESYVPVTPTPLPAGLSSAEAVARYGDTWDGGIGALFASRCGECHSAVLSEQNLDLTSYAGALRGGDSGPAVIADAPGISLVLLWPTFDDHPGKFSPLEEAAVWNWIAEGAAR